MFKLRIKTDNAAFHDLGVGCEVARILREIAARVELELDDTARVRDANGNLVGEWTLK